MPNEAGAAVPCDVKDPGSADLGKRRADWAFQAMPVLQTIRKRFIKTQPLAGVRIAACLRVTAESANLMMTLRDGGASVVLCASNPLSTMDDGAGLVNVLHTGRQDLLGGVIGGTEETTTGVVRLRSMARDGVLRYPIIAINDAPAKHLAGLTFVVAGYGWCGRGVAMRARGTGASVIVTEVDPIKALEALMDGCRVMSMSEAAAIGDVFVTVTGAKAVIGKEHFEKMKNGAILANAGHLNVEIDIEALGRLAGARHKTREFVEEFVLRDGRKLHLLGEGRPINLAAAEGHPASVMDLSFANQALSVEFMTKNHAALDKRVYGVPEELDRQVARMKLESMGVKIDRLTLDQERYLTSWPEGT